MTKIRHSSGDDRHPYTKTAFWKQMLDDSSRAFWESDLYTERGKQMMRESVERMIKNERREYVLADKPH